MSSDPFVSESTRHLIGRAHHGDSGAVDTLFQRLLPSLTRWARGRLPAWARQMVDTHDLVQDAVISTFSRLDAFESRSQGTLQAYLRMALSNRIKDEVRRVARRPTPVQLSDDYRDDAPSPLEAAVGSEALDRYERALERLRPDQREAVIGRIELGLSYEELAVALGKSSNAVRLSVQRALARLAEYMSNAKSSRQSAAPTIAQAQSPARRTSRKRQRSAHRILPREAKPSTVAALVADRTPVDWEHLKESTDDVQAHEQYRELRLISTISDVHCSAVLEPTDTAPANMPAAGEQWAHLVLIRPVGQGGFGTVYLARDPWLDRDVALKLLHPSRLESIATGVTEAWRLARVRDPNVVTVHGAHIDRGRVGVWMEYVDGRTLESVVTSNGPLPITEVIHIGQQLCRGLAAVHEAGLLHCDIKPQNIILERGGRVVLTDFGTISLAANLGAPTQRIGGTPLYMAPEVLAGEPPTVSSDTYAMAVTLFRLLTCRYPVEAPTIEALRQAHDTRHLNRLRDVDSRPPDAFVEIIETALSPDPTARPSVRAIEEALAKIETTASSVVVGRLQQTDAMIVAAFGDSGAFFEAAMHALGPRKWLLDLVVTRVIHLRARFVFNSLEAQVLDGDWSFSLAPFFSSTDVDPTTLVFLALYPSGVARGLSVEVTKTPAGATARLLNPLSLVDPQLRDMGQDEFVSEIDVVGLPYRRDEGAA